MSYEKQIVRTKDETYTHILMYVRHFCLHINSYLSKLIREPSRTKASPGGAKNAATGFMLPDYAPSGEFCWQR